MGGGCIRLYRSQRLSACTRRVFDRREIGSGHGMMVSARKRDRDALPSASRPSSAPDGDQPPPAGSDVGADVVLVLADLLRDKNGEVVLFNDSGMRAVGIATTTAVLDQGLVGRHVTADGVDVSGFRYCKFADGLKLFYPADLSLVLIRDQQSANP